MKGVIKAIVDEYAANIIRSTMAKHRLGKADFLHSNFRHCIKARSEAIRRLAADGFGTHEISRAIELSPTTVDYWLKPKERNARIVRRQKRYVPAASTKAARNTAEMAP